MSKKGRKNSIADLLGMKTVRNADGSVVQIIEFDGPLIPKDKTGRADLQETHGMLERLRGESVSDADFALFMGMTASTYQKIVRGELCYEDYLERLYVAYSDPEFGKNQKLQELQTMLSKRVEVLREK